MSRLLLGSVLTALLLGLTLLACVPIEEDLLPNVGDEMRITNNPEPNYDPCWYETYDTSPLGNNDGHVDLKTAKVAYHDGHTVYLYSFVNKSTAELYSAPAGFEITTLDTAPHSGSLFIALYNGTEARIIYRESRKGTITTIYQENGTEIESIGGQYGEHGDEYELLLGRADGNIYSLFIEDDQVDYDFCFEGFDVYRENSEGSVYSFVCEEDDHTIYHLVYSHGGGIGYSIFETLNNGHYNRYPAHYWLCVSNADGDNDIWDFADNIQITDKPGDEIELDATYEYVVFNRVEDGRSDIYVVRRRHVEQL